MGVDGRAYGEVFLFGFLIDLRGCYSLKINSGNYRGNCIMVSDIVLAGCGEGDFWLNFYC